MLKPKKKTNNNARTWFRFFYGAGVADNKEWRIEIDREPKRKTKKNIKRPLVSRKHLGR